MFKVSPFVTCCSPGFSTFGSPNLLHPLAAVTPVPKRRPFPGISAWLCGSDHADSCMPPLTLAAASAPEGPTTPLATAPLRSAWRTRRWTRPPPRREPTRPASTRWWCPSSRSSRCWARAVRWAAGRSASGPRVGAGGSQGRNVCERASLRSEQPQAVPQRFTASLYRSLQPCTAQDRPALD